MFLQPKRDNGMESNQKEILELFIITYNRSQYLETTLKQLIGCPFSVFPITVLDNCSTDNTYDIFLKYKDLFPKLNYKKNKVNVGADANVLRAAEMSDGIYTWILCDDDFYDFTSCNDVLNELEKKEAAAIMVGWAEYFQWPDTGMYDTPMNLMKQEFPYFCVPTFVPGSIFKTDIFQRQIRVSYTNIVNLLPVMTFYVSLYKNNEKVYVSKRKIVVPGAQAPYDYTFLRVMMAILHTFYLIDIPAVRRQAFYANYLEPTPYRNNIRYTLLMQRSESSVTTYSKFRYFRVLEWENKLLYIGAILVSPVANRITLSPSFKSNLKRLLGWH